MTASVLFHLIFDPILSLILISDGTEANESEVADKLQSTGISSGPSDGAATSGPLKLLSIC